MKTLQERFFEKVEQDESGCWNWTAAKMPTGYGHMWDGTRYEYAHRVAYRLFRGPVVKGMHVCHTCDNPGCVNPEHLWLGTHQQNMADRDRKGRTSRHIGALYAAHPEWRHRPRLSTRVIKPEQESYVVALYQGGLSVAQVAARLGVSLHPVEKVLRRAGVTRRRGRISPPRH